MNVSAAYPVGTFPVPLASGPDIVYKNLQCKFLVAMPRRWVGWRGKVREALLEAFDVDPEWEE